MLELVTISADKAPKVSTHAGWITCFLSAIPSSKDAVVFDIGEDLLMELRTLKAVFEPNHFESNLDEIGNLMLSVTRGDSDTYKIFSATGGGSKLLGHMRAALSQQIKRRSSMSKVVEYAKQTPSAEVLPKMDAEFDEYGYSGSVTCPARFSMLPFCLESSVCLFCWRDRVAWRDFTV